MGGSNFSVSNDLAMELLDGFEFRILNSPLSYLGLG